MTHGVTTAPKLFAKPTPSIPARLIPVMGVESKRAAPWALLASNLSDYGFIWPLVVVVQILRGQRRPAEAITRLGLTGVSSLLLTRLLKTQYVARPAGDQSKRNWVREPSSSRFPSGHTLASSAAALVIPTKPLGEVAAMAFAGTVAASRAELGAHEAVDLVAGALAGVALGSTLRWVLKA